MAGTDCPIFYLTPGYSLHEELALLVKAGLTPLEAIETATVKPTEYFKLEKELGLVQEGMLANLLLLTSNPLEDIRNTLQIEAVIRDGKLHNQAALDGLLFIRRYTVHGLRYTAASTMHREPSTVFLIYQS